MTTSHKNTWTEHWFVYVAIPSPAFRRFTDSDGMRLLTARTPKDQTTPFGVPKNRTECAHSANQDSIRVSSRQPSPSDPWPF